MVPSPSWYVTETLVSVFPLNIAPTMSCTASVVNCVLVSVAATVIVSVPAFVVIVTLDPAASVSVSSSASATTSDCPLTDIVLKEFSFASPLPPLAVRSVSLTSPLMKYSFPSDLV